MAEALSGVKRHFGPDAVILSTRTVTKGKVLGLGGGSVIEITAARQHPDLPAADLRGRVDKRLVGRVQPGQGDVGDVSRMTTATAQAPKSSDALAAEVASLTTLVHEVLRETRQGRLPDIPRPLFDTYQRLIENDVAEQIARQLVESVKAGVPASALENPHVIRTRFRRAIEAALPVAGPIKIPDGPGPFTVAFIGPTGVGKTTTVAKLAANFRLREGRSVGLVTIDTYRIAAVDQLRTYAQIIDVPLIVASSPKELADAVHRLRGCDVILLDTAGRSQRDSRKREEMRKLFAAAKPDEIHLVLSTTCGEKVLAETIERFSGLGVDRVILTKLDEAVGFGVILNCLEKANAKLSYVTTGQDVPDDIEVGYGGNLAELILGERTARGGRTGDVESMVVR